MEAFIEQEIARRRQPIKIEWSILSYDCKEDAYPQAAWLEREQRRRAEKAEAEAARNKSSNHMDQGAPVVDQSVSMGSTSSSSSAHGSEASQGKDFSWADIGQEKDLHSPNKDQGKDAYLADKGQGKEMHFPDKGKGKEMHFRDKGKGKEMHFPDKGEGEEMHFSDEGDEKEMHFSDEGDEKDLLLDDKGLEKDLHFADIGKYIKQCYDNAKICDMAFKINDRIWPVHRVILASQSSLFRAVLEEENFSSTPWTPKQIRLRGVEQKTLSAFLQFIYSGSIKLKAKMIPDLLRLAKAFEVEKLKILCHREIPHMPSEDLLKLLKIMAIMKDYDVCDIIMKVIADRDFREVRECDAFYNMDVQTLCLVLSYDGLNVRSELEVFDAAVGWLHHHNVEERLGCMEQVMDSIRFSLMTPKSLFMCYRKCPALKANAYCNQLITMANWIQTSMSINEEDPLNLELPTERNPVSGTHSLHQYLNAHCNSVPDPMDPVEFDIVPMPQELLKDFNGHACLRSERLASVPAIQKYSTSRVSKMVDNPKEASKRVDNPKEAKKISVDPYKEAMIWGPGDHWYLIGAEQIREGYAPTATNAVLRYSYKSKQWGPLAPMNVARRKHSLCVSDGLIYAIGGIGEGNRLLKSVECYNPRSNCWFFVKDLPEPRAGASASAEGGNIYLQGGYGGLKGRRGKPCSFYSDREVLRYNDNTNKWTTGYC